MQKTLASKLKKRTFNNIIINEGDFFDKIFFIVEGNINCKKNDNTIKSLTENEYFGEIGLFLDNISYFTYEPNQEVLIYELEYYQVAEIIGQDYSNKLIESLFKESIKNSIRLKEYFLGNGVSALYNIFHLEYFNSNSIIYSQNLRINKKICIVVSGKIVKKCDPSIIIAEKEDLFGENIIDATDK